LLVSCSVFWKLFSTYVGGEVLLLYFSSLSGWSDDARISLRVVHFLPGVCGRKRVFGGRNDGHVT
jgi:hypothetical protein